MYVYVDIEKCCKKKMLERITKPDHNGTIFLTTLIIVIVFFAFLEPLMQLGSNEMETQRGIITNIFITK